MAEGPSKMKKRPKLEDGAITWGGQVFEVKVQTSGILTAHVFADDAAEAEKLVLQAIRGEGGCVLLAAKYSILKES